MHPPSQWFLTTCGTILAVTSLAKLISVIGEARVLSRPDPVFWFLTFRQVFFLTGAWEMVVAWVLFFTRLSAPAKPTAVLWISATFLIYRLGLWATGYKGECPCLGHVSDWMGVAPGIVDRGMKLILAYLLLGSVAFLVGRRNRLGALVCSEVKTHPWFL